MNPHTHTLTHAHAEAQQQLQKENESERMKARGAAAERETKCARHNGVQEIPAGDADKRRIWKQRTELRGGVSVGKENQDVLRKTQQNIPKPIIIH